jgi:hypothetical protein
MTRRDARFTAKIPATAVDEWRRKAGFSSGASKLAAFLHSQAKDLHADHLSCASLLFHEDFRESAGYSALVNDAIPAKELMAAGPSIKPNITTEERRSRIK